MGRGVLGVMGGDSRGTDSPHAWPFDAAATRALDRFIVESPLPAPTPTLSADESYVTPVEPQGDLGEPVFLPRASLNIAPVTPPIGVPAPTDLLAVRKRLCEMIDDIGTVDADPKDDVLQDSEKEMLQCTGS